MPFIESILEYASLSIVGMEKNTGKTETLNYILERLPLSLQVAVTSIGTDGELKDIVTGTSKPEIYLRSGTIFATAERYYALRKLTAEILSIDPGQTAAGRVVTGRVLTPGKVMLSGPSSAAAMNRWREEARRFGAELTITDGALSRKSSASPSLSGAVILATGAAFSADPDKLVRETAYTAKLIMLPPAEERIRTRMQTLPQRGVWGLTKDGESRELEAESSFSGKLPPSKALEGMETIYVPGALTNRLLGAMRTTDPIPEVVVEDFTKIFVTSAEFGAWERAGGRMYVMNQSRLVAITVNPCSPSGIKLDSEKLTETIKEKTGIPAYDVRKCYDVR